LKYQYAVSFACIMAVSGDIIYFSSKRLYSASKALPTGGFGRILMCFNVPET
jgi:hypothetical protein